MSYMPKSAKRSGGYMPKSARPVETAAPAESSALETYGDATRGALQGVTLNFGDEIQGAMGAGLQKLVNALPQSVKDRLDLVDADAGDAYRYVRDADRAANKQAQQRSGKAYFGGEIAGGLLIPGGGAAKGLKGALALGAGMGAAGGLGASEAELTGDNPEYLRAVGDTAKGAALGLAGGGIGHGLGLAAPAVARAIGNRLPGREEIGNVLRKFAERRAYKAAGPMLKNFRQLADKGGLEEAENIGRELLDSDVIGRLDNVEDIAKKLAPLRNEAGEDVGHAIDALDNELATGLKGPNGTQALSPNPNRGFDPHKIADRAQRELVDPIAKKGFPGDRRRVQQLLDEVEAIRSMDRRPMKFRDLEEMKRAYDPEIRFDSNTPNVVRDAVRDVRGLVQRHVEEGAEALNPKLADAFKAAKRRFELLAPAEEMAGDQAFRAQANRMISPSDYLAGLKAKGDGKTPETLMAAVWAFAHNQLRTRGNAFAARTVDDLASLIHDPVVAQQATTILVNNPALAPVLKQAAERGLPALTRAIDALARVGGQDGPPQAQR